MMQFDLADEYAAVQAGYGYDLRDMEAISLGGIDASWAPADEKAALKARFRSEFDSLRVAYGHPVREGS